MAGDPDAACVVKALGFAEADLPEEDSLSLQRRGDADAQALIDAYADTLDRYREAFGEPPADTWIASDAALCRRTACKPQKCR